MKPSLLKRYHFQTIQKAIREEKFKFNRRANGEGENKFTSFQSEISEVQQLREKLGELKIERNDLREKLHKLIEEAKANVQNILFRTKILKNIVPRIKGAVKCLALLFNN